MNTPLIPFSCQLFIPLIWETPGSTIPAREAEPTLRDYLARWLHSDSARYPTAPISITSTTLLREQCKRLSAARGTRGNLYQVNGLIPLDHPTIMKIRIYHESRHDPHCPKPIRYKTIKFQIP